MQLTPNQVKELLATIKALSTIAMPSMLAIKLARIHATVFAAVSARNDARLKLITESVPTEPITDDAVIKAIDSKVKAFDAAPFDCDPLRLNLKELASVNLSPAMATGLLPIIDEI